MKRKWRESSIIIIVSPKDIGCMMKKGVFEIAYAPETPEGITVRMEPGEDGDVWMTVNDIAKAYGVFCQTVRAGLKSLRKSGDFDEYQDVRIEKFRYKGKQCSMELYNLRIVIALGFKMNGTVCRQFRKWVASRLAESYQRKPCALFLYMGRDTFMS